MQGTRHASYHVHLREAVALGGARRIHKLLVQLSQLGLVCLNMLGAYRIAGISAWMVQHAST